MRNAAVVVATLFLLAFTSVVIHAQQTLVFPRPSQKASVMQRIGVTDLTINYSRPGVKNRQIWGDPPAGAPAGTATLDDARARPKDAVIVPYGRVWRAGANEATQFIVTDDVVINGQPLKAGTYSLHAIPGRDEWTIIFNSDAGQWGSFQYDEKKDVLRIKTKPEVATANQEWLAYEVEPVADNAARVTLRWEKVRVPFTVEVKDVQAVAFEKARAIVAAAGADDWRTRWQAANYFLQNPSKDDDEVAMGWLEHSLKIKETFNNLSLKARVLASQGKTQEAIATGEKAVKLGKEAKTDTSALERSIAEWKTKS